MQRIPAFAGVLALTAMPAVAQETGAADETMAAETGARRRGPGADRGAAEGGPTGLGPTRHRALLQELITAHGRKGKWFAAAKTAGYLDIALECAADDEAAPATLIRAARNISARNPAFAGQVALHAIAYLLAGRGYDATPADIDTAVDHLMAATRRIDRTPWAFAELRRLTHRDGPTDLMTQRLRLRLRVIEEDRHCT